MTTLKEPTYTETAILDDVQAAWALREHRHAVAELETLQRRAKAEHDAVDLAYRDQRQRLETAIHYHEAKLVAHATALMERTGAKSQKWPTATIRSTTRTNLVYDDGLELWLAAGFPEYVRTKVEIDKAKVRAAVHFSDNGEAFLDGEPVPGIHQQTTTTWSIRHGAPTTEGDDPQ